MTGLIARAALPSIPWGRIGIAVGILAVTFTSAGWFIEARRADKLQGQVVKLRTELGRMSLAKNQQKVVTRDRIVEVERKTKDADTKAKRIETASLPGQCKTPAEVLASDL